jgi:hypothetical protein
MQPLHEAECFPLLARRNVHMSLKAASFLLLFLGLGAVPANADSVYEVIGTLTVPGYSPGVGETINYSFELDYSQPGGTGTPVYANLTGTPTVTSFGALGTAFYLAYLGSPNYVAFFDSGVTPLALEIDLNGQFEPFFGAPPPIVTISSLFACDPTQVAACSDFTVPPLLACGSGRIDIPCGTATAAVYLVPTPEPNPGLLMLTGVALLGLLRVAKMKRTTSGWTSKRLWQC